MANTPDPIEVVALAKEIMQLRSVLAEAERKWEALFGNVATSPTQEKKARGRVASESSFSGKIVDLLNSEPTKEFDIHALTVHFGVEKGQIDRAIQNLFAKKRIHRIRRGVYGSIHADRGNANVLHMDAA